MVTSTLEEARTAGTSLTRISVTRSGSGRAQVRLEGSAPPGLPVLRPVLVSADRSGARVALVAEGALLLAGDALRIEIRVGPTMALELLEPSGTVAYDMRGGRATWDVDVVLHEQACLVWPGEPFVAAAGCDVRRHTHLRLGDGARLALREQLVMGRHGEPPGRLHHRLDVVTDRGPSLSEEVDLSPATTGMLLGGHRVLGTVLTIGANPGEPVSRELLRLEDGGTLVRALADEAHRADLAASWGRSTTAVFAGSF